MQNQEIQQLIESGMAGAQIQVQGDGSHFQVIVISDLFKGKSAVEKQKMVYATINDKIKSGDLHAVSIQAYTLDEWSKKNQV